MLGKRSNNLAVSSCLALLVVAVPCLPCQCQQRETVNSLDEEMLGQVSGTTSNTHTSCSICEVNGKVLRSCRYSPLDHHVHLPAFTSQKFFFPLRDNISFAVVALHCSLLYEPDIDEARVLLE